MLKTSQWKIISRLILVMAFASSVGGSNALADDDMKVVAGRVTDPSHQPFDGAEVKLLDEHGAVLKEVSTDSSGSFLLPHKPCRTCVLEVTPPRKTGLASALIEDVPGDTNRNFVIALHKGFAVTGRVTHDGKGLKGICVKVVPRMDPRKPTNVHDGGMAYTGRDGRFRLILTPGRKHFEVVNDRYTELIGHYEHDATITGEHNIADWNLSAAR